MLAQAAMAAGMRTGLYTSPYVRDFRERIQADGEMIPKGDLARLAGKVRAAAGAAPDAVTEFEFVTALGFAWFAERGCDLVVLEAGMGGRWDATNVIAPPLCSVITKIAMDHAEVLGDTLAKIAAEKCGIVKPGRPVVCACGQDPEALEVIRGACAARGSQLVVADEAECEVLSCSLAGSECVLAGLPVRVPLIGRHMCRNALSAVKAARLLGFPDTAIQAGLPRVSMPARMEALSREPLVLLDGGHNPDCARALAAALEEICPGRRFCLVCGMMADKDAAEYLRVLRPRVGRFIACAPGNPRALPAETLAGMARAAGYEDVTAATSPEEALRLAGYPLVIAGSFYLAGEVRTPLSLRSFPPKGGF
jgi:dihydrofolate synthase/folylpolyglutamate synthase